jgi:hypothetical protein
MPNTEAKTITSKKRTAPARQKRSAKLPKPVGGAVKAALDKKASDVVVLDLRNVGGLPPVQMTK